MLVDLEPFVDLELELRRRKRSAVTYSIALLGAVATLEVQ